MKIFAAYLVFFNTILLTTVVLLIIIPRDGIVERLSALPTSWGALIGALIGLLGVAFTANKGFANLISAQEHRAKIERDARQHQAELNRITKKHEDKEKADILAYGLVAELSMIANDLTVQVEMSRVVEAIIKHNGKSVDKDLLRIKPIAWRTSFYEASMKEIGILGPSLAGDVYQIYSKYISDKSDKPTAPLDYDSFLSISESIRKEHNGAIVDVSHVHARLIAFAGNSPDPGPLWATERAQREREETLGKEQADKLLQYYRQGLSS